MPGETKTWSQFWYPIQKIGPAQAATVEGALSLRVSGGNARVGVAVSAERTGVCVRLEVKRRGAKGTLKVSVIAEWLRDLAPGQSLVETVTPAARGKGVGVARECVCGGWAGDRCV